MSFLHYLGLLLISVSWLWRIHLLRPPGDLWLPLVIGGLALLVFPPKSVRLINDALHGNGDTAGGGSGRADRSGRFPRTALIMLVPLLLAFFSMPRQLSAGPLVLALAILGGVLRGEGKGRFRPVTGCVLGGTVLTLQAYLIPLLAVVSVHVHSVPLFAYILYPFVRLFDGGAALGGGKIFVSSMDEIYGLEVSLEKLAFIPLTLYFFSVAVSRILHRDCIRSAGRIVLAFVVYGGVRFIFVLFAVVILNNERLFWEREAILLSFAPLSLFFAWIVPFASYGRTPGPARPDRHMTRGALVGAAALFTAAFFFLVGSVTFHDPGRVKRGRVLFDERYSDWEWSTQKYDREWYGQKSGYNYYSLGEFLGYYFDVERGLDAFTPEYLSRYDVVIVKTPTQPFNAEEIDAIEAYVRGGGGLFLIGDHTNVFGTSTNLNPVAARFGLRFNYDSTYDLATLALTNYTPPPIVAHPTQLHVPEFFFATSCTMESPLFGEHAVMGYGLRGVMLDYSRKSYFPSKDEKEYEFGFLMQMAGAKAGKGRVLGHTDSTVFSNFFMFIPGKPETFLGALDWLNRENRWHRLTIVFFIIGLASAACGTMLLRGVGPLRAGAVIMVGFILGLVVSVHLFESLKVRSYPPLQPKREMRRIAFDRDPSLNDMPLRNLVRRRELSLHTFYVWTQRLGLVPSLHPTLLDALASAPIAVIVNPIRRPTIDEIDAVVDFCRRGGDILLIADPRNAASSANDFLGIFRMSIAGAAADTTEILTIGGERVCTAIHAGFMKGGSPLLALPGGRVVFAYEELGAGRFFAFANHYIFTQALMGPTSTVPQRRQREIYELEYQILEILMRERRPDAIEPYRPSPDIGQ